MKSLVILHLHVRCGIPWAFKVSNCSLTSQLPTCNFSMTFNGILCRTASINVIKYWWS